MSEEKKFLVLEFKDGSKKELELSKAIHMAPGLKSFINLEALPDGTYKLVWTGDLIPDFTQLLTISVKS